MTDPLAVVRAHLAAFNARDLDAVMATFQEDAVFSTADHLVVGSRGIAALFGDAFREFEASLELRAAVVQDDTVACELTERVTAEGMGAELPLAAFYTVRGGRLARVKVYREGTA